MNKKIMKIFVMCFISQIILYAQDKKQQSYLISLNYGNNYFYGLENSDNSIRDFAVNIYPVYNKKGIGISAGYSKEKNGDTYCLYSPWMGTDTIVCDDVDADFKYIQVQFYIQGSHFGVIPGIGVLFHSGEGPGKFVLPSLSIRAGNLRKYFISIDGLHEVYHGGLSINMHYVLDENFSKISIGIFHAEDFGVSYDCLMKLFGGLYLGVRGNISLNNNQFGTQATMGIGF